MEVIKQCYELGLMALIPVYKEMKGDYTKIIAGGLKEYCIRKNIRTVINTLAKYKFVDLKQSRKYYGKKLGYKNLIPIPIDKDTILAPVKLRKPLCKGDNSFGYVNIRYVDNIENRDGLGVIKLKHNIELKSLQKIDTVEKHIRNGRLVESLYKNRSIRDNQAHNELATKWDIEQLKDDIIYLIKESL